MAEHFIELYHLGVDREVVAPDNIHRSLCFGEYYLNGICDSEELDEVCFRGGLLIIIIILLVKLADGGKPAKIGHIAAKEVFEPLFGCVYPQRGSDHFFQYLGIFFQIISH